MSIYEIKIGERSNIIWRFFWAIFDPSLRMTVFWRFQPTHSPHMTFSTYPFLICTVNRGIVIKFFSATIKFIWRFGQISHPFIWWHSDSLSKLHFLPKASYNIWSFPRNNTKINQYQSQGQTSRRVLQVRKEIV